MVSQPADREALAEFLHTAIQWADHPFREPYVGRMVNGEVTVDGTVDLLNVADKLLARWRLVPVEQEPGLFDESKPTFYNIDGVFHDSDMKPLGGN